jgi:hypothetical protein
MDGLMDGFTFFARRRLRFAKVGVHKRQMELELG